jgi:hypothetical protein
LPVNFIGFTGKKTPTGTQLTWKVADEMSVKFYNVEKSTNGITYSNLGMVRATGDKEYTFTDGQPNSDLTYYRIKNIDMDDRFKYSTVLSFRNGKADLLFKVFPTVVRNKVTVQHEASTVGAKITVTSADGRLVKSIIPSGNAIQTEVDLSGQLSGMYILRFDNGKGRIETSKIMKQ